MGIWSENASSAQVDMGQLVTGRLIAAMAIHTPEWANSRSSIESRLTSIGIGVASGHLSATDNFAGSQALSYRVEAGIHHDVFSAHGLPRTTYGGTPIIPSLNSAYLQGAIGNIASRSLFGTPFRQRC
jgi:hypothetical protein